MKGDTAMTTLQVLQTALDEIAATGKTGRLTIADDGLGRWSVGTIGQRESFASISLARRSMEGLVEEVLGRERKLKLIEDFNAADYLDFMRGPRQR